MDLCLYQPDIAGNLGANIRTASCFGICNVHIIMPTGFPLQRKLLKRSMLDYGDFVNILQYVDFESFMCKFEHRRIILMTTRAKFSHTEFKYTDSDIIMAGSESRGVCETIAKTIPNCVKIFMAANKRSLNVAVSVGIVVSEAMRQLRSFENSI